MNKTKIGVIGEYNPGSKAQILLNQSLDWLKESYLFEYEWVDTERVFREGKKLLSGFCGVWSAPGSPFKSLEGAIRAIRYARENNIPHLGTCGGMQHTVIEFARNVLGLPNVQHEEYNQDSSDLLVTQLNCSLAGKSMALTIKQGTIAFDCYKTSSSVEDYYCNFGINPQFIKKLNHPDLKISGIDQDGEIRIIEIPKNDFFIGTLFVPQSRCTREKPHPVIRRFVEVSVRKSWNN